MKKFDFKKYLHYVLMGLSVLLIATFFFKFINLEDTSNPASFTGFNAMFGITLDEAIESVTKFKYNAFLIIAFDFILVSIALNFVKLGKFEPIKRFVLPILYLFTAIAIFKLPTTELLANKMFDTTISTTAFLKVAVGIALLQFVISFYQLTIYEFNKDHIKYFKSTVVSLVVVSLFALFFSFVIGGTDSSNLPISGYTVIFGGSLKQTAFGVSKIDGNVYGIIGFILGLIGLVLLLLDYFRHNKIFAKLALGFISVYAFYLATMNVIGYSFVEDTYISFLTVNGLMTSLLLVLAVYILGRIILVEEGNKELINDVLFTGLLLILFSTYLPIYYAYKDYNSYIYAKNYYSAYTILFTKPKFNNVRVNNIPVIFPYALVILSIILDFIPLKNKKIKYLLLFVVVVASVVFFIATVKQVFADCLTDSYCKVKLYQNGISSLIILILSAAIYFKLAIDEKK